MDILVLVESDVLKIVEEFRGRIARAVLNLRNALTTILFELLNVAFEIYHFTFSDTVGRIFFPPLCLASRQFA